MRNSAGRKHSCTRPSVFTPPGYVWLRNLSENSLLFPPWSAGFSVEAQRGRRRCHCCCCRTQSPRWLLPLRHRGSAERGGGVLEEEGEAGVLYKKRLSLRCKSGRQVFSLKKMLVLRRWAECQEGRETKSAPAPLSCSEGTRSGSPLSAICKTAQWCSWLIADPNSSKSSFVRL